MDKAEEFAARADKLAARTLSENAECKAMRVGT